MDIGNLLFNFWFEKSKLPFDWERNNCCLFAADWAVKLTGIDPAARWRVELNSPIAALRIMNNEGGVERLAETTFAKYNWPSVNVRLAARGDIVLGAPPDGAAALGVCAGLSSWFVAKEGIVNYPTLSCQRAWKLVF